MRFFKTPAFISGIFPGLTWQIPVAEKTIFLTFDDGPIPEITGFVLETLAQYQAQATFFCVGANIEKHPSEYIKIQQAGHLTANHTFNHLPGWQTEN